MQAIACFMLEFQTMCDTWSGAFSICISIRKTTDNYLKIWQFEIIIVILQPILQRMGSSTFIFMNSSAW